MRIIILVLFSRKENLIKFKQEIENLLFSKIKKYGTIDLIVHSSFIDDTEINPEIFKDIDGVLYTSDVQREDVEKSTLMLKNELVNLTTFARISASIGYLDRIDFIVKDVITINNTDIYPQMIKYLKN